MSAPETPSSPKTDDGGTPKDDTKKQLRDTLLTSIDDYLSKWDIHQASGKGFLESFAITWFMASGVDEVHAEELMDCCIEDDSGHYNRESFEAGVASYKEHRTMLKDLVAKIVDEAEEADWETTDEAKVSELLHRHLSKAPLSSNQNRVGLKTAASMRSLEAIKELFAWSQSGYDKALVENAVKAIDKMSEHEYSQLVQVFTNNENMIIDLITKDENRPKLQTLWHELDANKTEKVSLQEVYSFIRDKYPVMSGPRSLMLAFINSSNHDELMGKDDGWARYDELPVFLQKLCSYNKLHYLFANKNKDDTVRFSKEEFMRTVRLAGFTLNDAEAAFAFGQASKDGSSVTFEAYVQWASDKRFDGLTLLELKRTLTAGEAKQEAAEGAGLYDECNKLVDAILSNDVMQVRALIHAQPLETRVAYVNQIAQNGDSVLFFALDPERIDILQLLLDYGADVGYANNDRNTVLHIICQRSFKKAIKMVIMLGADINAENGGYNKAHQMCKGDANQQAMQNLLNVTNDACKLQYKEKLVLACTPYQRAFCKSMFDILDHQNLGHIRFQEVAPCLSIIYDGAEVGPDPEHMLQFFASFDTDWMGTITFEKFLYQMTIYLVSKEPKKKKGKKKSKKKKKK